MVSGGDKSQDCGVEPGRVSVSTLSGAAALDYLSSAWDHKWSQFDGSGHILHRDISFPIQSLSLAFRSSWGSKVMIARFLLAASPMTRWQNSYHCVDSINISHFQTQKNVCDEPLTILYWSSVISTALTLNTPSTVGTAGSAWTSEGGTWGETLVWTSFYIQHFNMGNYSQHRQATTPSHTDWPHYIRSV